MEITNLLLATPALVFGMLTATKTMTVDTENCVGDRMIVTLLWVTIFSILV